MNENNMFNKSSVFKIIDSSINNIYQMRECYGRIIIYNKILYILTVNSILNNDKFDLFFESNDIEYLLNNFIIKCKITNFKGYFPWGIYEGDPVGNSGSNILVVLNKYNYVLIEGGYYGPHISILNTYNLNDIINYAFYVVCSGGDSGSFYAVGNKYIYTMSSYPGNLIIKRNVKLELKFNFNLNNNKIKTIPNSNILKLQKIYLPNMLVDMYMAINNTISRGFGYHSRDFYKNETNIKLNVKKFLFDYLNYNKSTLNGKSIAVLKKLSYKYYIYKLLLSFDYWLHDIVVNIIKYL